MIREDSSYRLLVEGTDDKHSVIHLMKRHGIDWDNSMNLLPYVYDCRGFDPLVKSIQVNVKSYECLGIMLDANENIDKRWQQVKNELSALDNVGDDCSNDCDTVVDARCICGGICVRNVESVSKLLLLLLPSSSPSTIIHLSVITIDQEI